MTSFPESRDPVLRLSYPLNGTSEEGMLSALPGKLAPTLPFDRFGLAQMPDSRRIVLWFRSGAKRVFHVRLIRRGGRFLISMSGVDPMLVLQCVQICKQHFDEVFGITSEDIQAADGSNGNP